MIDAHGLSDGLVSQMVDGVGVVTVGARDYTGSPVAGAVVRRLETEAF